VAFLGRGIGLPNRIIRDGILTSEAVNKLSWPAEAFYRRLMSVVDDFGRYYANPELLRAGCFPLKLDRVSSPDIVKWIGETREAGLVRVYSVEGKRYLELLNFRQQVRAAKSKFPDYCVADAKQVPSKCEASAHVDVDVVVDELNTLSGKPDDPPPVSGKPDAKEILAFLNEKAGRAYRPTETNLRFIAARLKQGASVVDCKQVIAKKCREWKGSDMEQFLRPATLFNDTKFNQYVGELVPIGGTNA